MDRAGGVGRVRQRELRERLKTRDECADDQHEPQLVLLVSPVSLLSNVARRLRVM